MVTGECLHTLQMALSGSYRLALCGGLIQVMCRPLPGRAIAAAFNYCDTLWVVLDLDKPSAALHARQLVCRWFAERPWMDEPAGYGVLEERGGQITDLLLAH